MGTVERCVLEQRTHWQQVTAHNVLANRKRQKKAGMKRMDVALPDAQPRLNS